MSKSKDPYAPYAEPNPYQVEHDGNSDHTTIRPVEALLAFMEAVDTKLAEGKSFDLTKLPNLIELACNELLETPQEDLSEVQDLLKNINLWLEETERLMAENEDTN